ncbi:MAG: hypothetical protein K2N07_03770, partial [Desulfovibrio sp.]|nr:hypothetical protein [Desulfovibrio sp.]
MGVQIRRDHWMCLVLLCFYVGSAAVQCGNAEIIRQKQPFCCWLRQRKISSVEYLSTLPSEIFIFLASSKKSYFLGFFRHQHPSSAALQ